MKQYKPLCDWSDRDIKKNKRGYVIVHVPEHPRNFGGYVYEHRLVIERKVGRLLDTKETVHHISGRKDDNREHNLFLCMEDEHVRVNKKEHKLAS